MSKDLVDRLVEDWARERPELDAAPMAVVGRIVRLGRILEARANQALKVHGLIYTDLDVLATLRRSGAPFRLTPTELGDCVLLTSGAMTAALNRLTKARYIRRMKGAHDARVRWVMLTERGRALVDEAIGARFAEAADAVAGLTAPARGDLAKGLKALSLSLEARSGSERRLYPSQPR